MAASLTRRRFAFGAAATPLLARRTVAQAHFPSRTDPDRHRLSARRRHRHPGAAHRTQDGGTAGTGGDRREPSRRERPDRDPGRRASRAGRPHHPVRHHGQPRDQSRAVRRPHRLRHGARLYAAIVRGLASLPAGGEPHGAREVGQGADRAREGTSGELFFGSSGNGGLPHLCGELLNLQAGHPHRSRALSRQRAGLHRSGRADRCNSRSMRSRSRSRSSRAVACGRSQPRDRSGWRPCPTCR